VTDAPGSSPSLRVDKWLWHARFLKSRTLAAKLCEGNRIRVNGQAIGKPSHALRAGDVLTFPLGPYIRVVKVLALGSRRGPAPEARALYEDLDPPTPATRLELEPRRAAGSGRPTKADRRATDWLKNEDV
jgi:ribosome-associated heat shock protein Hsp15